MANLKVYQWFYYLSCEYVIFIIWCTSLEVLVFISENFLCSLESIDDEDDNLPSMETLEISKKNTIQSIPSYFGGEEEEEIPDMAEFDDADNLVENDPVSWYFLSVLTIYAFTEVVRQFHLLSYWCYLLILKIVLLILDSLSTVKWV